MADDTLWRDLRVVVHEKPCCCRKCPILHFGVGYGLRALKLNADRKIITARPPLEAGSPGMPGPLIERDILGDLALSVDQEVGRDTQVGDLLKIGVILGIEPAEKELVDVASSELARR